MTLYNELDRYPAQWLRNLIDAGHIAPGTVDERSIVDLDPKDLDPLTQFHAFAGIGVWSHALRLAGWPDDAPVWTGSCPCQPFSAAGRRKGAGDERHLWPAWFRLIRECRPPVVFGEQVASGDGLAWLDAVQSDLEGEGYAVGALDLCAAGVGAPHIRQRCYFVAESMHAERWALNESRENERDGHDAGRAQAHGIAGARGPVRLVADAGRDERGRRDRLRDAASGEGATRQEARLRTSHDSPDGGAGFWHDAHWIPCRDGKARPTEPGLFPLAHGTPGRVGRLRAYGNAIVAPLAAEFVRAYLTTSTVPAVGTPQPNEGTP